MMSSIKKVHNVFHIIDLSRQVLLEGWDGKTYGYWLDFSYGFCTVDIRCVSGDLLLEGLDGKTKGGAWGRLLAMGELYLL